MQDFTSVILSGSAREVAQLLHERLDQRTVAVMFPDDDDGRAAERVMRRVGGISPAIDSTAAA
jgi:hypothetical protein